MRPIKLSVPRNISDLLDHLGSMLSSAPRFKDRIGYFPQLNLGRVFQELNEGLAFNRATLGDERLNQLIRMSDQMRALFEADPEYKTGDTLKGCKIIHEIEDILRQVTRKT